MISTSAKFETRNRSYDASTSLRLFYNAGNDTYTVSNVDGSPFTFDRSFETGTDGTYRDFGRNLTDGGRRLHLLVPGPSNPTIQLTYTSYGAWDFDPRESSGQLGYDRHFFYFGIPTNASAIPTTGSGSYSGIAEGILFDPDSTYRLRGTTTLVANFALATIATTLSLTASGGSVLPLPFQLDPLNGTASIVSGTSRFDGTLTTASNSFVGSFRGSFFGPQANEFGYSFAINSPDLTRLGGGVAVGK